MTKRVKIPGRLESAETGNIVTGADAVMDDEKGKTQVVINSEVDAAIISLAQGKQDALTFDNAPTEGSPNPVTSAGVYTADKVLSDAIETILLLIPSAASALNKLVDMQTMNSSIATATASFKGTYNLVSDLHLGVDATHEQIGAALDALSLGADNNDYAFVQVPNSDTAPTEIRVTERYKYNGANWLFEYDLNNSGFTQGQWNAINSGVTSLLVGKLSNLPTNAELTTMLAGKQDNLTFDNVPTAGSPNPVKSGGVYARNNEIVALINALDAAKQDVLTFDNEPVEGSPSPVKSGGVYTAISAVQAAIVALDAEKQNVLTFDSTPMLGSSNPVMSSGIKTELNRIDGNITTLNDLYEALTQSALVIVQPTDTWPVASPASKTIYRVIDRANTPPQYYSDYMWNGSAMVLMATYDNAIDDEPTAGSNNLVKSGGVAQAIHTILEGTLRDGKYINTNGGVVEDTPYTEFKVTEYDVTGISGYVRIQTNAGNGFPLFSLQDAQGNVIVYQHDQSQLTPSAFLHVDNAAKLYVTSVGHVEFFNNDAITELFGIVEEYEPTIDYINGLENVSKLNIDISQYIQWDKWVADNGTEMSTNGYAYVKLPSSLFTVGKRYYFKGKASEYVPGVVYLYTDRVDRGWNDDSRIEMSSDMTYVCVNLSNVNNSLGVCLSLFEVGEINNEIYTKSQTVNKTDEQIDDATIGDKYREVNENCTFYINKRFINGDPVSGPVDADGYVCARFDNIDPLKIYAADCISSQYVPGYITLDSGDHIITQGNQWSEVVYSKEQLYVRSNTTSIILQALVPSGTTVNDVTVKSILKLYIIDNTKKSYSVGEIYKQLYQRDVKIKDIETKQASDEAYKTNQNYWKGKSIAWFGTSIPEGGVWVNGPTYPNKVGKMLDATATWNEAVGGSCAANVVTGNTSFQYWYIRMGHSVKQQCDMFRDAFTVDYTNQTVTAGPRTLVNELNISGVPEITTYADAIDLLAAMVSNSYQIKLVHRYLISDVTEREAYLSRIFSGYENELNAIKNLPSSSVYSNTLNYHDVDLIVFDHGHNDGPSPIADAQFDDNAANGIDTIDMSTWLGAMNTYMRLVMFYKPKMRVVQISDYYYSNIVKAQEQFSRRWQIPYCEVWKSLPYLYHRFKVTVRGYWDANGIWHDKGFTWTEPTNMSDANISDYTNLVANSYELEGAGGYGTGTIGALKVNINPRQENGEWVWDTNLSNIFMKDGLHPGSDYTWKCVDLYARVLVQFMKGV